MDGSGRTSPEPESISLDEAVMLGAGDGSFFGHFFFPKAFRQVSPPFHVEIDQALDNAEDRYVSAMIFRGAAKTTKLRVYIARRIAYGISRTILVIGKSQEHAVKSVEWLMKAVKFNRLYADTFGLSLGDKQSASDIEIVNESLDIRIRIIALGITGSVRGVNIDDYRPDLIIVDDPCDEENTATPEQRKKISDLFFGAIQKSLAPASEMPHAKMVLLQTILNEEDLISLCEKDSQWKSFRYSCFTDTGESRWPERWTTQELQAEKQAHIDRNQLSLWLREMECKVVSDENSAFLGEWLQYWDVCPDKGIRLLCIDPTPPPRDIDQKPSHRHDDAVIMDILVRGPDVYVVDYYTAKSPDTEEFIEKIFEMALRSRPQKIRIETHMAQRVIADNLERAMVRKRTWYQVEKVEDRRPKPVRIRQDISSKASHRKLYFHRTQTALIEQYMSYPNVNHDDLLDALSIGISGISAWMEESFIEGEYEVMNEKEIRMLDNWRSAP